MGTEFSDNALRLSGAVMRLTGWTPETFWAATPAELAAILGPPTELSGSSLTRSEFDALLEQDRNG